MPPTDLSETGLEVLIVRHLTGQSGRHPAGDTSGEPETPYLGRGYLLGDPHAYDRDHAVDEAQLFTFLSNTQGSTLEAMGAHVPGKGRTDFLHRLDGEIAKRGVIDVLRRGVKHGPHTLELYHARPTPGNALAAERHAANRFSLTRQLRYSLSDAARSLDLVLFLNGLPLATFELKNRITGQTVEDAVEQYKRDRDPREKLFGFGRCLVHFALDDAEVRFCTHLRGPESWFLPFNKGHNKGAGNPPNPTGPKSAYLWEEILVPASLVEIVEAYALQVTEPPAKGAKRGRQSLIFPRYHQLSGVRALLADVRACGAGRRYLVQHSAGSGKSNSIAWLVHQLVEVKSGKGEAGDPALFDSVIVVTDRRALDRQLTATIRAFAQVDGLVAHADASGDLRRFLASGKKVILTTIQKFPFVLDEVSALGRDKRFAIVIDEAHSSQGGQTAGAMNQALSAEVDPEDYVNDALAARMSARKLLTSASYFAFTATPKNKTLELFGTPQPDGTFAPFHAYTMKQAIEEGFILDVLQHYTTVESYYRLEKAVENDPEYDAKKARKKLAKYVEGHPEAIRRKAEIIVEHFIMHVYARHKVGGQARALVATAGIERAIDYYHAIEAELKKRGSPVRAIVAFSGEFTYGGKALTEASLNGFPSADIPEQLREDPYRLLVVADKYLTGFDEPLLYAMYVDKPLSDIKAVQGLSRLNRAHPKKRDTFVLDFANDVETIRASFERYYRATLLSEASDPNTLHDLKADLDSAHVYEDAEVEAFVDDYLAGSDRGVLEGRLNACEARFKEDLSEQQQVDFKSTARTFVRMYGYLSAVLPYALAEWERLSIFLTYLVPRLPAPKDEDLSAGLLDAIDMDSYRPEMQATMAIVLKNEDAAVEPPPVGGSAGRGDPELDRLSNILQSFNDLFGGIEWSDADRIRKVIADLPEQVAADEKYRQAVEHSDEENARVEHDQALRRVIFGMMKDHGEFFRRFNDDDDFKRWLASSIFDATYRPRRAA
ncbi:MAG: DEAD/DEAH box helicase family protein [Bacteroidetes bacterium]|nr:DEAD/DEAH box helicase family protein [Bacteroidota bacterium]